MRTSLRQVAQHAGVSHITVSRVLSGHADQVSPATQTRVLEAVKVLNYVPVASPASQRRHVETRIIGLVFDQVEMHGGLGASLYEGLRLGAMRRGYDLLMLLRSGPEWAPDREEVQFLDRRSDGFIFVAPIRRQRVLQALVEQGIPVVACGSVDVPPGVGRVLSDNADEMRQAVEFLHRHGHRRIMHIAGPSWNSDHRLRTAGFAPAMHALGLAAFSQQVFGCDDDWVDPRAALDAIQGAGATAVLCGNDMIALNLWRAANENGLKVPQDFSLIGIDDTPDGAHAGLTSVNTNLPALGQATIEAWVQLRQGASWNEVSLVTPVRLVERGSVCAPTRPE